MSYSPIHRSSCHIIGSAVELLYDENVDSPHPRDTYKLISNRLQLSWKLEEWRETLSVLGGLVSISELIPDSAIPNDTTTLRLRILLTIQYYRIAMLINYPVLAALLDQIVKSKNSQDERAFTFLRETATPVVKHDWLAAKELCQILHALSTATAAFLDPSTDWWTCNYTSKSFPAN